MARKKVKPNQRTDAIPTVFSASSPLFKEWLQQEVQKRIRMKQDATGTNLNSAQADGENQPPPRQREKC